MKIGELASWVPGSESAFSTASNSRIRPGAVIVAGADCLDEIGWGNSGENIEVFIDEAIVRVDSVLRLIARLSGNVVIHEVAGRPLTRTVEDFCAAHPVLPETVIMIGGGSAIDFAKGAVAFRCLGGKLEHESTRLFSELTNSALQSVPFIIGIPTTAGSGAEQSRYFVLYDDDTGAKNFGRSWGLTADLVAIDPLLLKRMPAAVAVASGFDAFVHLLETLINASESSQWSKGIALAQIPLILRGMEAIVGETDSDADWTQLGIAASLAGNAISNVRTGLIHEAAGPLTEFLGMPHGQALFVCARACLETFDHSSQRDLQRLFLDPRVRRMGLNLRDLMEWWRAVFTAVGIPETTMRAPMQALGGEARYNLRLRMSERLLADGVLREKTHPRPLSEPSIYAVVDEILEGQGS